MFSFIIGFILGGVFGMMLLAIAKAGKDNNEKN